MIREAWPTGDIPTFMFWEPPGPAETVFTWHLDECAMCGVTREETGSAMHLDHAMNVRRSGVVWPFS